MIDNCLLLETYCYPTLAIPLPESLVLFSPVIPLIFGASPVGHPLIVFANKVLHNHDALFAWLEDPT